MVLIQVIMVKLGVRHISHYQVVMVKYPLGQFAIGQLLYNSGFRILNMFNRESWATITESVVELADSVVELADSIADSSSDVGRVGLWVWTLSVSSRD